MYISVLRLYCKTNSLLRTKPPNTYIIYHKKLNKKIETRVIHIIWQGSQNFISKYEYCCDTQSKIIIKVSVDPFDNIFLPYWTGSGDSVDYSTSPVEKIPGGVKIFGIGNVLDKLPENMVTFVVSVIWKSHPIRISYP